MRRSAIIGSLVAALGAFGFAASAEMQQHVIRPRPLEIGDRREVSKRSAARARAGWPLNIKRKGNPGVRAKKPSRTKSRKRRRAVVRMRGHR